MQFIFTSSLTVCNTCSNFRTFIYFQKFTIPRNNGVNSKTVYHQDISISQPLKHWLCYIITLPSPCLYTDVIHIESANVRNLASARNLANARNLEIFRITLLPEYLGLNNIQQHAIEIIPLDEYFTVERLSLHYFYHLLNSLSLISATH